MGSKTVPLPPGSCWYISCQCFIVRIQCGQAHQGDLSEKASNGCNLDPLLPQQGTLGNTLRLSRRGHGYQPRLEKHQACTISMAGTQEVSIHITVTQFKLKKAKVEKPGNRPGPLPTPRDPQWCRLALPPVLVCSRYATGHSSGARPCLWWSLPP